MMTKVELRLFTLMGILQSDGTLIIKNKTGCGYGGSAEKTYSSKVGGLLKLQFGIFAHPSCHRLTESIFSLSLVFHNQSAPFWLWQKQEATAGSCA